MRRIRKIELEKEMITCDTCGANFEERDYNIFKCMICHKDVCKNCAKQMEISFNPIYRDASFLRLCPHCFETLTLKKLKELDPNEK